MTRTRAFSPGHITGLFSIHDSAESPLERGSLGAGFSISHGVFTDLVLSGKTSDHKTRYSLNGELRQDLTVSKRVVSIFGKMGLIGQNSIESISHTVEIPQGCGFGSSGAGALSLSLALNQALGGPLSREKAGAVAHQAEVECKTGLGTVIGEFFGGFEVRTKAGAPGIGTILPVIPAHKDAHVLFIVYHKISTSKSLSDPLIREKINRTGKLLIEELLGNLTVETFLQVSRKFDELSELATPEVQALFSRFDRKKIPCAMLMFGNAAFAYFEEKEDAEEEAKALSRDGEKGYLFISTPSQKGGYVVE
jgi:pantoate kinase